MDKEKLRKAVEILKKSSGYAIPGDMENAICVILNVAQDRLDGKLVEVPNEEEIEKILIDNCYYENREDKIVLDFSKVAQVLHTYLMKGEKK